MRVTYQFVVHTRGLVNLEKQLVIQHPDESTAQIIITSQSEIDNLCEMNDKATAIANIILDSGLSDRPNDTLLQRIEASLEKIREERKSQFGLGTYFVYQVTDSIDQTIENYIREFDQFCICEERISTQFLIERSRTETEQLLTSIFLATGEDYVVKKVFDFTFVTRDDGKLVRSTAISISGRGTVITPRSADILSQFGNYLERVKSSADLDGVFRLIRQTSEEDQDNLRGFLFAWTALEIFINSVFSKTYKARYYQELINKTTTKPECEFFQRVQEVMKDKYALRDKFLIICALLGNSEFENDLACFERVKKVRDHISHGVDDVRQKM